MKIVWVKDFKAHKKGEIYECKDRNFDYLVKQGLAKKYVEPARPKAVETATAEPEAERAVVPITTVKRARRKAKTQAGGSDGE